MTEDNRVYKYIFIGMAHTTLKIISLKKKLTKKQLIVFFFQLFFF